VLIVFDRDMNLYSQPVNKQRPGTLNSSLIFIFCRVFPENRGEKQRENQREKQRENQQVKMTSAQSEVFTIIENNSKVTTAEIAVALGLSANTV